MQLNKGWRTIAAFWNSMLGSGAEGRLLEEVLKCLPAEGRDIKVEVAASKLENLGKGRLIAFCGLGLQSVFSSARNHVNDIKGKRAPPFETQKGSAFALAVMEQVACFFKYTQGSNVMSGKHAMQAKFTDVQAAATAGTVPTLTALGDMHVFPWLLAAADKQQVEKWTSEAVKADVVSAAADKVNAAASSSSSIVVRKKTKVASSARDMVLGLLS